MHAQFAHRSSFQFTMAELLEFSIFEPIERHREYVPHSMLDRCKMACKKFVIFAVVFGAILVGVISVLTPTYEFEFSRNQGTDNKNQDFELLSNELTLWKNLSVKNCKEQCDKGLTTNGFYRID